jgi:hypothetical protein
MLTTRCSGSATVLLCALLLQDCQSNSLKATEEEGVVAGFPSALAMRRCASSEPLAMGSLTLCSTSLTAHVSPSCFSATPASREDRSTAISTRSLSLPTRRILATVINSPKAPYNLSAASMLRFSHAMLPGRKPDHALSPDSHRVRMSRVEGVLREVPSNEEEDSTPPVKRRYSNLTPESDLSNKKVRDEKGIKPDKAKERVGDVRLLSVKTPEGVEAEHCVEQERQSRDVLTILLDIAGSEPNKAIQLLDVLLVATQDKHCRHQALEALVQVAKASPDMFSECLPSLRAAAKEGDKDVRLLILKTLGEVEWKHYFGEVESVPDLPSNMTAILDSACPFWPCKRVRDTHLLVLIPAKVNGQPFSLDLLRELIQNPNNGGHKTKYRYYGSGVQAQFGASSLATSYWLLMTRDVLPESSSKTYVNQKRLVAAQARRTGLPYELPKALEAATAILTYHVRDGERLYGDNPRTYTRCQEWILHRSNEYPALVGGFESSGLKIRHYRSDSIYGGGVAGCWKLF